MNNTIRNLKRKINRGENLVSGKCLHCINSIFFFHHFIARNQSC